MKRPSLLTIIGFTLSVLLVLSLGGQERQKAKGNNGKGDETPKVRPLPDDERLMALHRDFVKKAEGLAREYENDKQWGKARSVYEEILKLVPQYASANAKLAEMLSREATAKSVVFNVKANEGWQDTGVDVIEGKPIHLTATGTWVFQLEVDTNAEGLTIPKELRDFNPGCLIGFIPDANANLNPNLNPNRPGKQNEEEEDKVKPFVVGNELQMIANRSGRLFLRMYDIDPKDNSGALKVEIQGTFDKK